MKVLTSNVKLTFTCENDNCNNYQCISDPVEMCNSGIPICENCGDDMVVEPECLVTN